VTKEEVIEFIKTEPDFEQFETFGYPCIVLRLKEGNLNGYVGIPKEHHLYGKLYSDKTYTNKEPLYKNNPIDIFLELANNKREENEYRIGSIMNVHGGVTYSRNHFPNEKINELFKDKELWWFGFDTSHAGDMVPFNEDIDLDKLKDDPNLPEELKEMFKLLESLKEINNSEKSFKELNNHDNDEYRTFEYVKLETQILAENLKYHE
jgi:hypothetical protein